MHIKIYCSAAAGLFIVFFVSSYILYNLIEYRTHHHKALLLFIYLPTPVIKDINIACFVCIQLNRLNIISDVLSLQQSQIFLIIWYKAALSTNEMATPTPLVESVKDTIDNMLLLSALREDGKAELLEILESIPGSKCLVTDVQLGGLLNQVIVEGSRFLKDNDVDHFKELRDEGLTFTLDGVHTVPDHIIYLVRPQLPLMSLIANQIKAADRNGKV